ncbi:response regulator [Rhodospirillaceae bacterium KN72]|uniref:Response regulator n=1 Tax=Pacificispira spongiicola TaxID=2729598 RepID=A0A7Y0HHA3_9PROT|nr:response regulator [Pacificispira spongiicola]NMM46508.1 response regulator [Pacificispira spongiicola]
MAFQSTRTGFIVKILLVEDLEADAILLSDALSAVGHSVEHYVNGREFCDKLQNLVSANPTSTVLVLDLIMPEKDGYEVIREIGNVGLKLPTILMTAQDGDYLSTFELLSEAFGIPILAHFRKPVKISELIAAISDAR